MANDYFTLISSLPHLPAHFDVDRVPITRRQLLKRLSIIEGDDADDLLQLTDFLSWDRQVTEKTDDEINRDYERLCREIIHPIVREIMQDRVNIRTIVGALRRRRRNQDPPAAIGPLVPTIRKNWGQPQFGIGLRFAWIEPFETLMESGRAIDAERVLYETMWHRRCRMADRYTFSFEAVLLYLTRWSIIDRWTSRDAEAGLERFDKIIEETLGEYAAIQF